MNNQQADHNTCALKLLTQLAWHCYVDF